MPSSGIPCIAERLSSCTPFCRRLSSVGDATSLSTDRRQRQCLSPLLEKTMSTTTCCDCHRPRPRTSRWNRCADWMCVEDTIDGPVDGSGRRDHPPTTWAFLRAQNFPVPGGHLRLLGAIHSPDERPSASEIAAMHDRDTAFSRMAEGHCSNECTQMHLTCTFRIATKEGNRIINSGKVRCRVFVWSGVASVAAPSVHSHISPCVPPSDGYRLAWVYVYSWWFQ